MKLANATANEKRKRAQNSPQNSAGTTGSTKEPSKLVNEDSISPAPAASRIKGIKYSLYGNVDPLQKGERKAEPPFIQFLTGTRTRSCVVLTEEHHLEAPCLPPLADPELFDLVFLQASPVKFKNLSQSGDELLKKETRDILFELFGPHNERTIRNIMPLSISNVFYEQLYLQYGFEKLHFSTSNPNTHAKGDVLEAYIAAIERELSRLGQSAREIRQWLFRILAVRLKRVVAGNDDDLISTGTDAKSLTIIQRPLSSSSLYPVDVSVSSERQLYVILPIFVTSSQAKKDNSTINSPAAELWSDPQSHMTGQQLMDRQMTSWPLIWNDTKTFRFYHLRSLIFDGMRLAVAEARGS